MKCLLKTLGILLLLGQASFAEESKLDKIIKENTLKVCIWPQYYGISYLDPRTQKLKGIETLSDVVGFQLWYWDYPGDYTKMVVEKKIPVDRWIYYKLNPELPTFEQQLNDKQISNIAWETKGNIHDGHYGKYGNQEKARMLINFFKKHKI